MPKRESQLHDNGTKILRRRGWYFTKLTTLRQYGSAGWPDVLAISPAGKVVFIEWKLPGKEPTERQAAVHEELRRRGQTVWVIHTTDELTRALARLEKKA